jgi:uncharacterized protein YjiS (DUF1127 family)
MRVPRTWQARHRQRAELSMMSEHDFADLGISRDRVAWEIDKRFWRDWSPQWNDTPSK